MKVLAVAALVACAAAQHTTPAAAAPSTAVKLTADQQAALASLSSAQEQLNAQNSQMIAQDHASQSAAILSQSHLAMNSDVESSGLESSELEHSGMDSDEDSDSGASALTGAVLALAVAAGAAMF
ncbi:hypothetical protein H4R18_003850 [Coemansia javaensis]|uniref:Uncharacterized protein n=1 Tax=Coemansia javaensis TaxID=2761396 RepID=A0A9W8LGN3_9FUNG|nr:hypothetical protein H4R18_003850 [Coemansia javaensis]